MHKGREEHIMNLCDEHSVAKLKAGGDSLTVGHILNIHEALHPIPFDPHHTCTPTERERENKQNSNIVSILFFLFISFSP